MDVFDWAIKAEPGETVAYGFRAVDDSRYDPRALESAYKAHCSGLVFLAQRRKGHGFQYEATRVSQETARHLDILPRPAERQPSKGYSR